ncbi:glycosyl hydrolase family 18 protein [Saccharomonospora sp. NPDC046836]|uniref:glycosyl hydrolase family 18 protein n=1 Tax=Saccharomonospora sp. NPDC046836 TaxID=3156921 RepID=UPI0033C1A9B8
MTAVRSRSGITLVLVCELLAIAVLAQPAAARRQAGTIIALPYWYLNGGTDAVLARPGLVSTTSPWLYGLDSDGNVVRQRGARGTNVDTQLDRLRSTGVLLVPTLANVVDGRWRPDLVARLLHDPDARRRHAREIAELVRARAYAGIDIDYEELRGADRDVFTAFLRELKEYLRADGKTLSVEVFAKTTDAGYDERNRAQDYAAIGAVADQVRVMAYDFHWPGSAAGPIAPLPWVRDVLGYVTTQVPAAKVVLGIPGYGYDWRRGRGHPLSWAQAFERSQEAGVRVEWDSSTESPHFRYQDKDGTWHDVWFENAYSAATKFDLAREFGVGGISLWLYGPQDDLLWTKLSTHWLGPKTGSGR